MEDNQEREYIMAAMGRGSVGDIKLHSILKQTIERANQQSHKDLIIVGNGNVRGKSMIAIAMCLQHNNATIVTLDKDKAQQKVDAIKQDLIKFKILEPNQLYNPKIIST